MVAARWVDDTDESHRRGEWEASWFAAAFLMPQKTFEDACSRLDLPGAAGVFAVGLAAAELRKTSLAA